MLMAQGDHLSIRNCVLSREKRRAHAQFVLRHVFRVNVVYFSFVILKQVVGSMVIDAVGKKKDK
jgi:hypothetical protein